MLIATPLEKMNIFNFIKRGFKNDLFHEQTIRQIMTYIPEPYRSHRQFKNSVEFLENREWELALDSLIELSDETEHHFTKNFWMGLVGICKKMKLNDQAEYCRMKALMTE